MAETYRSPDPKTGLPFFRAKAEEGVPRDHSHLMDARTNAALCRRHAGWLRVMIDNRIFSGNKDVVGHLEEATTRGNEIVNDRLGLPEGAEGGWGETRIHPVLIEEYIGVLHDRAEELDRRADNIAENL